MYLYIYICIRHIVTDGQIKRETEGSFHYEIVLQNVYICNATFITYIYIYMLS